MTCDSGFRIPAFRTTLLKACFFPSVLSLLQSVVEEGWLKMLRKRKFREMKTADEEKALLEKSFSKSTDMSQIGLSIVAQWQNARLNKQAANEEARFHVEREKIRSLDANITMTVESLNFLVGNI